MVFYATVKRYAKTALVLLKTSAANILEVTLKHVFVACGKIAGRCVGKATGDFAGESLISAFYIGQHHEALARDIGGVLGEEIGEKLGESLATKLLHWIAESGSDSSVETGSD